MNSLIVLSLKDGRAYIMAKMYTLIGRGNNGTLEALDVSYLHKKL
jgi:hypothetical protein